jgi:hypothetical protein
MPVRVDMGAVFNGAMILALGVFLMVLWMLGSVFNILVPLEHLGSLFTLSLLMMLGGVIYIFMGIQIKRRQY